MTKITLDDPYAPDNMWTKGLSDEEIVSKMNTNNPAVTRKNTSMVMEAEGLFYDPNETVEENARVARNLDWFYNVYIRV